MVSGLAATLMSVAVIAAFALVAGGVTLIAKRRDRKKGALMLAAAAVLVGNLLIWTI